MRRSRALLTTIADAVRAPPLDALLKFSAAALRVLIVEKDARLAAAAAHLASVEADKDARLAAAAAHLASMERDKDARITSMERDKDARISSMDAHLASVERARDAVLLLERTSAARDVSLAKHAADVARGVLDARGLFESALAEIVRRCESRGRGPAPPTVSAQLEWLFGGKCPEFVAYVKAAAADNETSEKHVLKQARKLFDVLSERPHSGAIGSAGAPVRMPADLFERSGAPTLIAFAALVAFAGRDLRLYDFGGGDVAVKLRAPAAVPGAAL